MGSKRGVTRKCKPRPGQFKPRLCDIIITSPNRPDLPVFPRATLKNWATLCDLVFKNYCSTGIYACKLYYKNVVLTCTCRFDRILSEFGSCHAKPIDLTQDCDSEASLATSSSSERVCIPLDGNSEDSCRLETTLVCSPAICTLDDFH